MKPGKVTLDDLLTHAQWMRGLAFRLLGDADEADDIVQETWMSALRVGPVRGFSLRPWIATVMRNLVRSRSRKTIRARDRESAYNASEVVPSAEDRLLEGHMERRLAELVLSLEEPFRRTVLGRFHEGRSAAQIARDEGVPEGTVRWRCKRGLDLLRAQLSEDDDGRNQKALAALLPVAAVPPPADLSFSLWQWLTQSALAKGAAIVTAAGTTTAVTAVVIVGLQAPVTRNRQTRSMNAGPAAVQATGGAPHAAAATLATEGAPLPRDPSFAPPQPAEPAVASQPVPLRASPGRRAVSPSEPKPTQVVGIVHDGRGMPAARVPVTVRTLKGSAAAESTTTTDDEGRFRLKLRPHNRFLLTAELKDEPAARMEVAVPASATIQFDADPRPIDTATIDLALDPGDPHRLASVKASPKGAPLSRWCCRQAFSHQNLVYARACLKFEASSREGRNGCDLYGLKAQVSCQQFTHGGVSTGDLSRTEALACEGRLM